MKALPFYTLAAAAAAALGLPGAAHAQTAPGKVSMTLLGGADFPISGDVHGGATAPVPDLGPLNSALAGVDAELRIGSRSYDQIYGTTWNIGAELAYGIRENAELFGQFRFQRAGRGTVQVGGAFVPALDTTLDVNGTFDRLSTYAIEVGYRQFFGSGALKPYVAGRVGAAFTDSINATFVIPDADIAINNAPFYKSSTSFVAGGDLGLSYKLGSSVDLIGEVGLRYTTGLRGDDSAIGGLGLAAINNGGGRLDVPVRAGLKFHF